MSSATTVWCRLVDKMLGLYKQLPALYWSSSAVCRRIAQIEATDRKIDALVYELYDLTPDEIAIVEGV